MTRSSRPRFVLLATMTLTLALRGSEPSLADDSRLSPEPSPGPVPQLTLTPCTPTLSDPVPHHHHTLCGTLQVWEDQDTRRGRRIDLRVVIVRGPWSDGSRTPIVELVGGPGAAATEIGDLVTFGELYRDRDLVLMDARGTGGSHPLRCTPEGPADRIQTYLDDVFPMGSIEGCRDTLSQDADLRFYNTRNLVADLDDLRRALGQRQLILFGSSYGTRVTLEYLRKYPSHVAFAVLVGVAPPGYYAPRHFARHAQVALDHLYEACESDVACRAAYPRFREQLEGLFARIRKAPITVSLANPMRDGAPEDVTLSFPVFAAGFRYLLYSSEMASRLPYLVRLAANDAPEPLLGAVARMAYGLVGMIYFGQYASFDCAEGPPFLDVVAERAELAGTWFGDTRLRTQLELCASWPRGKAPDGFHQPVTADVPVLLISGEVDPVTPPSMGEHVAATLPDSRHLILRGASHASMEALAYCAVPIMLSLAQTGTFDGVDLSCHGRTFERPPFFLGEDPPAEEETLLRDQ